MTDKRLGWAALAAYAGSVWAANWLIATFGVVPVPLTPFMAPAGFYAVGIALALRDAVQDTLGRWWTVGGILAGAALSALLSPQLAIASGLAFLFSELVDFAIYTPLRRRNRSAAIAVSNTAGALVDSVLFLWLAGLPLALTWGQWVGKVEMVIPVLVAKWLVDARRRDLSVRRGEV